MARGYPEPRPQPVEEHPRLVARGICVICKRRPTQKGERKCATCAEALARP